MMPMVYQSPAQSYFHQKDIYFWSVHWEWLLGRRFFFLTGKCVSWPNTGESCEICKRWMYSGCIHGAPTRASNGKAEDTADWCLKMCLLRSQVFGTTKGWILVFLGHFGMCMYQYVSSCIPSLSHKKLSSFWSPTQTPFDLWSSSSSSSSSRRELHSTHLHWYVSHL